MKKAQGHLKRGQFEKLPTFADHYYLGRCSYDFLYYVDLTRTGLAGLASPRKGPTMD